MIVLHDYVQLYKRVRLTLSRIYQHRLKKQKINNVNTGQ